MTHDFVAVLGFTAAIINVFILVPQTLKTVRTKQTRDISQLTFILMNLSAALWVVYGLGTRTWPVVLANGFTLLFASIILAVKFQNDR